MELNNELKLNLSAQEILKRDFTNKFKGYDPLEVDEFLDLVIKDYELMSKEIISLRKQLNKNSYPNQIDDNPTQIDITQNDGVLPTHEHDFVTRAELEELKLQVMELKQKIYDSKL